MVPIADSGQIPVILVSHHFFCLLPSTSTRDQQQIRPERFDLEQWTFCVLPTCINNKSSLPLRLLISEPKLGPENKYHQCPSTIDQSCILKTRARYRAQRAGDLSKTYKCITLTIAHGHSLCERGDVIVHWVTAALVNQQMTA